MHWLLRLAPYVHLFPAIRLGLFAASGSLIVIAGIGLLIQARHISDSVDPLTRGSDVPERRRNTRIPVIATFEFMDGVTPIPRGNADVLNICRVGCCLLTRYPLKIGDSIQGRLHRKSQGITPLKATVIWQKPRGAQMLNGVRFDGMELENYP